MAFKILKQLQLRTLLVTVPVCGAPAAAVCGSVPAPVPRAANAAAVINAVKALHKVARQLAGLMSRRKAAVAAASMTTLAFSPVAACTV